MRFGDGNGFQSPLAVRQRERLAASTHGYQRESFQEHVARMLGVYCAGLDREIAYAAARLERHIGLDVGSFDRAIQLAIALHDVGKLDRHWQQWVHSWQERISQPVADDVMLAHSDYDPASPHHRRAEAETTHSRPPHAAEGALAVVKLLHHLLGASRPAGANLKLLKAVFSAIARHHSPGADTCHGFDLHPAAKATILRALAPVAADVAADDLVVMRHGHTRLDSLLVQPDARDELLAYFLIVRMVRLADQAAMAGSLSDWAIVTSRRASERPVS